MHERFSDRARHAMALANQEAAKLGHDYLAPAHLMLGLIGEGNCVATDTLRLLDIDLDAVRDNVQARMDHTEPQSIIGRRAHTKSLKEVIQLAITEARKFGHRYVGTEHLVLGLLAYEQGIPSQVLREFGVKLDDLREQTLGMLRSDRADDDDLQHSRYGHFEWIHQAELSKVFRSPRLWHAMILAVDSANRLGAGEVLPQHLLLALLRDPENGVSGLLADKGVTADWLREHLAAEQ